MQDVPEDTGDEAADANELLRDLEDLARQAVLRRPRLGADDMHDVAQAAYLDLCEASGRSVPNPTRDELRLAIRRVADRIQKQRERDAKVHGEVDRWRRGELGEAWPGGRKPRVGEDGEGERIKRAFLDQAHPTADLAGVVPCEWRRAKARLHRDPLGEVGRRAALTRPDA